MKPRLPWISILLMTIFMVGGSAAFMVDWPQGPAHLDWGVWVVVYFGYVYIIAASVIYVLTGR
jgi:hypothetical protein